MNERSELILAPMADESNSQGLFI